MHGQIKIKQFSLLLSQIKSFSPTFFSTQTYEGVEGNGVWFETILLKQRSSSSPLRMISDQASFPLAQKFNCQVTYNDWMHNAFAKNGDMIYPSCNVVYGVL
ncbi:hypothetical protein GLYMA_20G205351v4 [Glycine max]|nr:hypothetical protein GLYMA_20G205351v4 [Glycine max]KAH1037125.1 hypothetical protein GYH30_056508 [Glycine max]